MANKGTIMGNVTGSSASYYQLWIDWETLSQSISANTSVVKASLRFRCKSSVSWGSYSDSAAATLTINGVVKSVNSITYNCQYNTSVHTLAENTLTISHNANGSKTINISATFTANAGSGMTGGSVSGTAVLDTIPRASTISAQGFDIGQTETINIQRNSSSFTDTITYQFLSLSGTIATNTNASYVNWDTSALKESFIRQIPNASSANCLLTVSTYSGSTLIGTNSINVKLTVPSDTDTSPSMTGIIKTEKIL